MNRKRIFWGLGVIALVVGIAVGALGWWLLSPLFIDETVDEAFPIATNIEMAATADIPAEMEAEEVAMVMEVMSRMDTPVEEAMPAMMDAGTSGPSARKAGTFRDADSFHRGSGTATIYQLGEGTHVLRLEDFSVTNGPDLHVLLTGHPDPQDRDDVKDPGYVDLGSLKGNIGNQNYEIPATADIDSFGSVVIYCQPFHVVFSVAALEKQG